MPDEIRPHGFIHAASLLGGAPGVVDRCLGPLAGISGFNGPLRQLREIGVPNLHLPTFGQEVSQRVEVVSKRKRNLL